ncbi:hypothetical protein LTR86_007433 [Recurvomyces mirabilis]|nr:hypothetical protein LTR86_007433 [Recurvomyces mirabilis]
MPSDAPAGQALLAWTWQIYEGNREYYMNCAPVQIDARPSTSRRHRRKYSSFNALPYLWKANLDGVNNCSTTEAENVVYPHPGPAVEYANGMNSSSPITPGVCDGPLPYGRTYLAAGQNNTSNTTTTNPQSAYTATTTFISSTSSIQMSNMAQSTTTITIEDDCDSTVTVFVTPSVYTASATAPASACTATADQCPCAPGYGCQYLGACDWQCIASPTPSAMSITVTAQTTITVTFTPSSSTSSFPRSTSMPASSITSVVVTSTVSPVYAFTPASVTPSSSSPSTASAMQSQQSSGQSSARPQYATGDPQAYLPCVPGTFLCTSSTSWLTCNYNDGTVPGQPSSGYVYESSRDVAAGMECLPYLSPYSSQQSQYAQQAMTPTGYYRDDRYVRSRPDGDCSSDGALQCTNSGTTFDICDQGGWVQMGSVAPGTTCQNGQIVAS